jgi:hypothetical protein
MLFHSFALAVVSRKQTSHAEAIFKQQFAQMVLPQQTFGSLTKRICYNLKSLHLQTSATSASIVHPPCKGRLQLV